jgi:glycosyltransferase involved in cell wall biosynthesis
MSALVSIIMPCRNAGRMLRPALASALAQSHPSVELIFVDDRSDDGSVEIAREIAQGSRVPVIVTSAPEPGVNAARKHGLSRARGDFVQWLDADDAIAPDKIARQVEFLEAHSSVDIAFGDWIERDHHGKRERRKQPLADCDQIRRTLSMEWLAPHAHLLHRAAADRLAAEDAFFPSRPVATDVEYFAIAAMLGMTFGYVPGALATYNIWSPGQMSSSTNYLLRAETLRAIFARLAAIAERDDVRRRVKSDHRALLKQSWELWALPAGSLAQQKGKGRHVVLTSRRSGKSAVVSPHEAKAVPVVESANMARFLAHHATGIMERDRSLFADQAEAIFFLDRLRAAGLLLRVDPVTARLSDVSVR